MTEMRPTNADVPEMRPPKRVAHERVPNTVAEVGGNEGLEMGGKCPIFPHAGEKLTWQQSYDNLQVYKQAFGDCNVPQKFKMNLKLGGWVVRFFFDRLSQWSFVCFRATGLMFLESYVVSFHCRPISQLTEQAAEKEKEPK